MSRVRRVKRVMGRSKGIERGMKGRRYEWKCLIMTKSCTEVMTDEVMEGIDSFYRWRRVGRRLCK